jgi:hypothetical protein
MADERVAKDSTALDEATDRVIREMTQVDVSDDAVTRVMARVRAARGAAVDGLAAAGIAAGASAAATATDASAGRTSTRGWFGALLEPRVSWGTVAAAAALAAIVAAGVTTLVLRGERHASAPLVATALPPTGAATRGASPLDPARDRAASGSASAASAATNAAAVTSPAHAANNAAAAPVAHPRRSRAKGADGFAPTVTAAMVATPDEEQPRGQEGARAVPQDVRLDVTINDQSGAGKPVAKTVSMVVADREEGAIRSQTRMPFRVSVRPSDPNTPLPPEAWNTETLPLNVEAWPTILPDGHIRVKLVLSYRTASAAAGAASGPLALATVEKSLIAVLSDGKPLVVSESADAATDRKVTVEVKATIQK